MNKSLKKHLEKEFDCPTQDDKTITLNEMLVAATEAETYSDVEKIDSCLVELLQGNELSEEREEVVEFVLGEVQKMYEAKSKHSKIAEESDDITVTVG